MAMPSLSKASKAAAGLPVPSLSSGHRDVKRKLPHPVPEHPPREPSSGSRAVSDEVDEVGLGELEKLWAGGGAQEDDAALRRAAKSESSETPALPKPSAWLASALAAKSESSETPALPKPSAWLAPALAGDDRPVMLCQSCNYLRTWMDTHCCRMCEWNPGRHGPYCDRLYSYSRCDGWCCNCEERCAQSPQGRHWFCRCSYCQ